MGCRRQVLRRLARVTKGQRGGRARVGLRRRAGEDQEDGQGGPVGRGGWGEDGCLNEGEVRGGYEGRAMS